MSDSNTVEAVARVIAPRSWEVMDAEKAAMLTKEQVEEILHIDTIDRAVAVSLAAYKVKSLCDMALGYLAMQPRPIEEAPTNGTWILGQWPHRWQFAIIQWAHDGWYTQNGFMCHIKPTHFSPLAKG